MKESLQCEGGIRTILKDREVSAEVFAEAEGASVSIFAAPSSSDIFLLPSRYLQVSDQ
jgi:hypothetical protein